MRSGVFLSQQKNLDSFTSNSMQSRNLGGHETGLRGHPGRRHSVARTFQTGARASPRASWPKALRTRRGSAAAPGRRSTRIRATIGPVPGRAFPRPIVRLRRRHDDDDDGCISSNDVGLMCGQRSFGPWVWLPPFADLRDAHHGVRAELAAGQIVAPRIIGGARKLPRNARSAVR